MASLNDLKTGGWAYMGKDVPAAELAEIIEKMGSGQNEEQRLRELFCLVAFRNGSSPDLGKIEEIVRYIIGAPTDAPAPGIPDGEKNTIEQYNIAHATLDSLGVPAKDEGGYYNVSNRIKLLAETKKYGKSITKERLRKYVEDRFQGGGSEWWGDHTSYNHALYSLSMDFDLEAQINVPGSSPAPMPDPQGGDMVEPMFKSEAELEASVDAVVDLDPQISVWELLDYLRSQLKLFHFGSAIQPIMEEARSYMAWNEAINNVIKHIKPNKSGPPPAS